jgi:hypothetical protein
MAISTADLQKLVNDITTAAQQVAKVGTVAPNSFQSQKTGNLLAGKVFEAWVLLKLGVELADELTVATGTSHTVEWHSPPGIGAGNVTPIINTKQQDAPWVTGADLSHVRIVRNNQVVLQLYNSIKLLGFSGANHEADIVIVYEPPQARPPRGQLPFLHVIGVIELKLHGNPISPGLVRQTALARLDLAMIWPVPAQATCTRINWMSPSSGVQTGDLTCYHAFATYSSLSDDAEKIANHYKVTHLQGIGSEVIGGGGATLNDLAKSLIHWRPT